MKLSKIFLALYIIATSLFISSCSKYEDGPGLSLRTSKARLTGEWQLTKRVYNGKEETLSPDDKDDIFKFNKDGTYEILYPGRSIEKGDWYFSDGGDMFFLHEPSYSDVNVIKILRLTNKEMVWLQTEKPDKTEFTFEKK